MENPNFRLGVIASASVIGIANQIAVDQNDNIVFASRGLEEALPIAISVRSCFVVRLSFLRNESVIYSIRCDKTKR